MTCERESNANQEIKHLSVDKLCARWRKIPLLRKATHCRSKRHAWRCATPRVARPDVTSDLVPTRDMAFSVARKHKRPLRGVYVTNTGGEGVLCPYNPGCPTQNRHSLISSRIGLYLHFTLCHIVACSTICKGRYYGRCKVWRGAQHDIATPLPQVVAVAAGQFWSYGETDKWH